MLRTTIFSMTLSIMLVTWSCEQLQQEQKQEQQQQKQQRQQQEKYHNSTIMQNVIDLDMPILLHNAIAACCSVVREYFATNANSFMLSTHVGEKHLKWHMRDFLNNVLHNLSMIKVEIEDVQIEHPQTVNRKFNLIVIDGVESLRKLDPAKLTANYDIQEYYLLYFMHASRFPGILAALYDIFLYFWENSIINVTVMKVNGAIMEAFTYYPFDSHVTCKVPVVRQINLYSEHWIKPIDSSIFPQKIFDLQRCPLTVAVWNTPPYFSYVKNSRGLYDIDYFEGDLLIALANKLNFSLDLQEPPNNEQRGKILKNGSLTGAMKMLQDRTADFSLGSFRYTLERIDVLTAALPYYLTWQIYGVLKTSQLYTSLEILVYAFDNTTWLCLFISIQFTIILALIIQYYYDSSIFMRFVIGFPRIKTPLINVISVFLGQPLAQIPQTNLTRFIIILWHIFGLLMRTAYQSLLFQLLKRSLYHQPPQSLADLIDQKCTLVMTEVTYESIKTVPRIALGLIEIIQIKNTSEQSTYYYIENENRKRCLAGVSPKDYLTYHAIEEHKRGVFYILPERIFDQHITMYFGKHSFLINRFNELFMNLRSMGLIDFWATQSLDMRYFDQPNEKTYNPISFNNVKGVFIIYLYLIFIAIVTFLLEFLYYKLRLIVSAPQYEFKK